MKKVCHECGFLTEDLSATVCPNGDDHPPLALLDETPPAAAAAPPVVEGLAEPVPPVVIPLPEAPPKAERAPDAPAAEPPDDRTRRALEKLRELKQRAKPPLVIGLMGFSTTGKTWLLNRLKHEFGVTGRPEGVYELDPPLRNLDHHEDRREPGTRGFEMHRFALPQNAARGFYILDIEGERFRAEMARGFQGADEDLLEAIDLCNAYLFVIPAAEYLFTPEMFERELLAPGGPAVRKGAARDGVKLMNRRRYDQIETMDETLGLMMAMVNLLGVAGGVKPAKAGRTELGRSALLDHLEKKQPLNPKPAALVLTMADLTQPFIDISRSAPDYLKGDTLFDCDPLCLVADLRPAAIRRLRTNFRWWKVDFASAFARHPGGLEQDYTLEHHGVVSLVSWFRDARREAATKGLARWAGANAAILTRRIVDPEFRRHWRDTVARPPGGPR